MTPPTETAFVAPETADAAAVALGDAARNGQRVGIRGGGTKFDWCAGPLADGALWLSTARINRIVAHRHGDLTATVEAGARLADVNRALAAHGQWLALDPLWPEQATIGGIVATNDAGPRRHRYGSPRDQIIGVEFALADGTRAKSGGIVVKNVAGYDLARLLTGSFGCLALVLNATFKLYPLTSSSRTVVAELPSHHAAGSLVAALNASQLTPTALELHAGSTAMRRALIRFESTQASTASQSAAACALAESHGALARVVDADEERREWQEHLERPWSAANPNSAIVKMTVLPSDLASALDAIATVAGTDDYDVAGRAGLGVLYIRLEGVAQSQAAAITALRNRLAPGRGSVVLLKASAALRSSIDAWGPIGGAFRVMQAVKRAFDPNGILNPGRGPGGI